jgi:DNA (cytosine-5)-methyltransferase 1
MIKHLDLFSGIGGFSLAAQWVGGIETTQFVEINPFCQKVLAKNFPGISIHDDITTFSVDAGDYDLITAGFPCQPHSEAGKRKASEDDRDLWPETYRIICEVRPRWVVLENVRGLLSSESGRFFGGILRDLATAGFDAEWAIVSCADLGGSHRRDRVWIVAYPKDVRLQGRNESSVGEWVPESRLRSEFAGSGDSDEKRINSNADRQRCKKHHSSAVTVWERQLAGVASTFRMPRLSQPAIHRGDDGIPDRVDRVKSLGNSIVPQVAMIPLQRILDLA